MVRTERKTNIKKTLLTLTAALGLTISVMSAKADEGIQTDNNGRDAFTWNTSTIDDQNGYYTHQLTIISLVAYLHLSSLYCDQMGGDGGTYGYFGGWTFSYTTTNPQCKWYWTFEDT